ncbi:O-antigen ligase family protein [Halomonas saccharevitans]|uniref:O-antigen ligase family protein n=1 Tax=Halomonas saccharevitans TaxID=416872 RepID=A0ABU3NAZ8_9GAMM|nr:O-antigen ligase family protein [Halomonas saccharevitans]MDT8878324.1 O-antigen ligase family protein [Halomonas saccharevitans]
MPFSLTSSADRRGIALSWPVFVLVIGIALGILLPWQAGGASSFAAQRGAQFVSLMLLIAVGGWPMRRTLSSSLPPVSRLGRWLSIGGVLLASLSVLLAPLPAVALLELAYLSMLGVAAVLVWHGARCLPRLGWVILGGLIALFMLIYAALAADHLQLVWAFANRHDFGPGFANVRFFADVAVGLMPLAMLYALARRRPSLIACLLCFLPLSFWWWLLWVSESRAALLGLFVGAACAFLVVGRAARWPVLLLALSAALGLAGWWTVNPLGGGSGGEEAVFLRDITSSSRRFILWPEALGYAVDHFPLGIGPMGFAYSGTLLEGHAHNLFFNTAAEWGFPLMALLVGVSLYGAWVILRRGRNMGEEDKRGFACLVIAFVGVMVNAQFAGSHIIPLSAMVMVLVIGLVFGYRPSHLRPSNVPASQVPLGATLLWAALMLVLAYLLYAGAELYWLAENSTSRCFQELGRAYYYPRFWAQGRLECMQMTTPDHWLFWTWRG